jgi:hypothetical protein
MPGRSTKKVGTKVRTEARETATARCLCGAVEIETGVPVFWAWHDHSAASRKAHGAVYATYVGAWRSKTRVKKGEKSVTRFEDAATGNVRSFCACCGSPLMYERKRSPRMVNLPRALFTERTGREPRYHIAIDEMQDWIYTGAPLAPLKGYPGVVWERPKAKKRNSRAPVFEPDF